MMDIRYQTIEPGSELMLRNWTNARLLRVFHHAMTQCFRMSAPQVKKKSRLI